MQSGWTLVAVLSLAFPAGGTEQSTEGGLRPKIERLLALAVEPSAKNMQAVERYYRSLPGASRSDRELKYAYLVALIQQKRLHDATKIVHELADEQPDDFAIWRSKIWLALTLGERTRALTDIEQLASHAQAHQAVETERLAEIEMAEFFGGVCGFLSGPWSQKVRPADSQHIEDRLRAVFDDESRTAFDQAKAKVVERYDELRQAHEERAEEELKTKSKQLDEAKKSVGRAAQDLGDKRQALKDKETKRTDDTKARVADIDNQLQKLDQQRQALLQQIAPLEAQRLALVAQLLPEGPFAPQQVVNRLIRSGAHPGANNRRIRFLLAPLVAKLTSLEGQVTSLTQHEQELLIERAATGVKYQNDLSKLAGQEAALDKDRKRIKNDAKRLKSKPVANSPRLRAEAEQLTRFSTYAPFPFEREKERLLAEAQ